MLTVPAYVEASGVVGKPVTHGLIGEEDYFKETKLDGFLLALSLRGSLAFAAAVAEWIAWRYQGLADNKAALDFAEAVWVGEIDSRYVNVLSTVKDVPKTSPAASALGWASRLLYESFKACGERSNSTSLYAGYLAVLARNVLPVKKPFDTWVKAVIDRMVKLYLKNKEEPLGVPVPREAFNPAVDYDPATAPLLLRAFLASRDPDANPFLRKPKELADAGFPGIPYQL